jgi:hypothetical protein
MPNQFSTGSWFPNLSPQIADFSGNLFKLKMHEDDLAARIQQMKQQQDQFSVGAYGTVTPTAGAPTLATQTLDETKRARQAAELAAAEAQRFREAEKPHLTNFNSIEGGTLINSLSKFGADDKNLVDVIKTMGSTPGVNKQQALTEILKLYPNYRQKLIDDSVSALMKNNEKDQNYINTPQGQAHQAFISAMDSDPGGEEILGGTSVFGPALRALKMEDAAQKVNLLEGQKADLLRRLAAGEKLSPELRAVIGAEPKESDGLAYHIEKEQTGGQKVQDYRVFVDKQGNVTKREPVGKPYTNTEGVANVRVQAGFAPQQAPFVDPATGAPMTFDKSTGSYSVAPVVGGGGVAPRPVNPSAAEREKTAQIDVIRDQLTRIKESYKPQYVGLLSGQVGRITQWANPDEAAFRQIILDVKDSLLRARSGAQINEQEYARLAKLVPDMTDSEPQFAGKMKSFERTLNTLAETRASTQQKGGVASRGNKTTVLEDPLGIRKGR